MSKPITFNPVALKVVMARRRITPPELAAELHKKSSKVYRFLVGINEPSSAELRKIAEVLRWPIGFFTRADVEWPDESAFSFRN